MRCWRSHPHGGNFQYRFNKRRGPGDRGAEPWLKLTRSGNTITSYASTDGQTWTQVGSATVALGGDAQIGLFVTSHNGAQLSTATFDNVSVTSACHRRALPAPWTGSDVGGPALAGSPRMPRARSPSRAAGNDIWGGATSSSSCTRR